jgi:ferredoxin-NADP reductase
MYRLTLYVLIGFELVAIIFSAAGILPFSPVALVYSALSLVLVCWGANELFAKIFRTHTNIESAFITALILSFLVSPPPSYGYFSILPLLVAAGIFAMASKYILAIWRKHIFNPTAIAVIFTAIVFNQYATWWIGTPAMLAFVVIGGILITRKVQRFDVFWSFLIVALASISITSHPANFSIFLNDLWITLAYSPILFFAFVMLTEPLTMPATRPKRIVYGLFVGLLFNPSFQVGPIFATPELALCLGNILSFAISPKRKYLMTLKEKYVIGNDADELVFVPDHPVKYAAGQYMEWTLAHKPVDNRGNRRFFTIASSPTDPNIRLGIKFSWTSSSFKNKLMNLNPGETILAGQVSGDFTLPKNPETKLAFMAGGIGITPFTSMMRYLMDKKEKRDVVLVYSNNLKEDIAYPEIWKEAQAKLGAKNVYTLTTLDKIPSDWNGHRGYVTSDLIRQEIPDYSDRLFYVSGPHAFVQAAEKAILGLGVSRTKIRTDYFPGFV